MVKQFSVRYGRNYKVVLAIVLPCVLIVPFIFLMQEFKTMEEWKAWLVIYIFLAAIIGLSLWLVLRVYPSAVLSISKDEISMTFEPGNFLSPSDFSFNIRDISSFTRGEIGTDEYFIFETLSPARKFQVSSTSYEVGDALSFNEAMVEISEMVNAGSG